MHVWRQEGSDRFTPPGHYGGLQVSDVVTKGTSGNFNVQVSHCPPGGGGEMHWHDDDGQVFVIIDGELTFTTDDDEFTLNALQGVLFEPGERHATHNRSDRNSLAMVITVTTPP